MISGIKNPMIVAIKPHGHHLQYPVDDEGLGHHNSHKVHHSSGSAPPTTPSPEPIFCMTLDELLEVIAELLPDEVILCTKLVDRLRSSRCLASSPLSADAEDVYRTFAAFVDSQQNTDSRGLRYLQQRVNNFAQQNELTSKDVMPTVKSEISDRDTCSNANSQDKVLQVTHNSSHAPSEDGSNLNREAQVHAQPSEGSNEQLVGGAGMSSRKRLPYFPGPNFGGLRERCFVLFDDASQSIAGKMIDALIMLAIIVSTVSFVMESMPQFRKRPSLCAELRARGEAITRQACEPKPDKIFYIIETVCIAIFTIEYFARVLTVHAMASSTESGLRRTLQYARQTMNIIDLLAILPYFTDLMLSGSEVGPFAILRLARILRLFKMAKHNPGMRIFVEVMVMSGQPLSILVFFNVIITVMFGSLIFFAEGQKYSVAPEFTQPRFDECLNKTVSSDFPQGVYVRGRWGSDTDEITPFRSIPYSLWWVCVTMTTVGYGDYAPTTLLGKLIGVCCFYVGIIFLALPISVLGTNFEIVYERTIRENQAKKAAELAVKKAAGIVDDIPTSPKHPSQMSRKVTLPNGEMPCFPAEGNILKRIFILFEDSSASRLGKILSVMVLTTILVSTVSFVMESMPEFNHIEDTCNPNALTVEDCEPVPAKAFYILECVCIMIFTVDYICRVGTVHQAHPEECGLNPARKYTKLTITLFYCAQWLNLIDLVAIIPFYVELAGGVGGGAGVLRVLRLIRVFRVLKMPQLRSLSEMFINVVIDALPALFILFFMTTCSCVLMSSCLVFAEGTNYSVDHFRDTHPEGVYIRPKIDGYGMEETPFVSIFYAFWWFFTTATTVGYGDDVPTTTAGRIVGVITFYTGIILLALPVTIVGGSFSKFYPDWVKEFKGNGEINDVRNEEVSERCESVGAIVEGGRWHQHQHQHAEISIPPDARKEAWS